MKLRDKLGRKLAATVAVFTIAAATSVSLSSAGIAETKLVIANSQWLDALRGAKLWAAVKAYEATAPGVTLEQEAIPSAQFEDRMTTELAAGQGPDLVIAQDALFYALADAGFMVPIDDVTEGVTTLNSTNDKGVIDGTRLGIAWHRAPYALIYNKPIIEELGLTVPTNIDELLAATKVAVDKGYVGFIARHQMNEYALWFKDFENWTYGYGAKLVDADGKITLDTPEMVEALTAFKKLYDSKAIPIGDDMTTQRSRFKENKAAFGIENSGSSLNISSGGALKSTDLGAAPMPFPNPGVHQQIFIGVSKHSMNQDAAKAFLKWLITPEGQASLRAASGPDALATDVPVAADFVASNPWSATFAELAPASNSALIPGYEVETSDIMRYLMGAVEKVLIASADPKTALAEAQTQIDAKF